MAANPQLAGRPALAVLDAVVAALARARVFVILDNHVSDADWCCDQGDENGLWFNDRWSEAAWLAAHAKLAAR